MQVYYRTYQHNVQYSPSQYFHYKSIILYAQSLLFYNKYVKLYYLTYWWLFKHKKESLVEDIEDILWRT